MDKIHRIKSSSNFMVLHLDCLRNNNLSLQAMGLHCYMMSLPDGWEFNMADLKNRFKNGRDSISSAMKELIDSGYVLRKKNKDLLGKFAGYEYHVSDTVNGFSVNGFSVNGKSVTSNNPLVVNINNRDISKGEEKFDKKEKFSKPKIEDVIEIFLQKKSTEIEAEKFFSYYDSIDWFVGKNKMKNWRAAVTGWVARNKERFGKIAPKTQKNEEIKNLIYENKF
jgi:predicted transcriptional regulator